MRALTQLVVSDIQPLTAAQVIDYLASTLFLPRERQQTWLRRWNQSGLRTLGWLLADDPGTGPYCHGNAPALAGVCVIPQVFAARRFGCDLVILPMVVRICDYCTAHPAFVRTALQKQSDAPAS